MDNICRTCMRTSKKLIDLRRDDSLTEKILILSSIQVSFIYQVQNDSISDNCGFR